MRFNMIRFIRRKNDLKPVELLDVTYWVVKSMRA